MERRFGSRKMAAITHLKSGEYQIAIPTHGWFSSSNIDNLKRILNGHGYGYVLREEREES